MLLFGTIGTLTRFIDMPSSVIALGRAFFSVLTIILVLALRRQKPDWDDIKRNIGWLIMSSVFMCCNWVCQFEAFKYTTIAVSTLCYYMQPVFYILAAAIVIKEKLSPRKLVCVAIAFCGMIFVSGVLQTGLHLSELKGVLFGIAGGFFYAMVVLINKYMKDISPVYDLELERFYLGAFASCPVPPEQVDRYRELHPNCEVDNTLYESSEGAWRRAANLEGEALEWYMQQPYYREDRKAYAPRYALLRDQMGYDGLQYSTKWNDPDYKFVSWFL